MKTNDSDRSNRMAGVSTIPKLDKKSNSGLSEEDHQKMVSKDEFQAAYGEQLTETLNLDTWKPGTDLAEMYTRLEGEIIEALKKENEYQIEIRKKIFPMLRDRKGAPKGAGVYRVGVKDLERVHRQILFNGALEACDGIVVSHDTLPITIIQIGVCLVSYQGDQGSWVHRIFRRDLRTSSVKSPIDETLDILDRRRQRGAIDYKNDREKLSALGRRGIMAYAERAVLLERSESLWRMGHGNPTPYELVTGSGMVELVKASLKLLRNLILDYKKFLFIPSAPSARELLTIGNALKPLEYAIVDTNKHSLDRIVKQGHYRGSAWGDAGKDVEKFIKEAGDNIIVGAYRASKLAPAQMFYAHIDYAHEAALIAMADSVLQEHRGFPMLIDLADKMCSTTFGADTFHQSTSLAYTLSGEPFRYLGERSTRS